MGFKRNELQTVELLVWHKNIMQLHLMLKVCDVWIQVDVADDESRRMTMIIINIFLHVFLILRGIF